MGLQDAHSAFRVTQTQAAGGKELRLTKRSQFRGERRQWPSQKALFSPSSGGLTVFFLVSVASLRSRKNQSISHFECSMFYLHAQNNCN